MSKLNKKKYKDRPSLEGITPVFSISSLETGQISIPTLFSAQG
uniref:Uncharacterized protein n=1 Tax=Rhizophora mucronata TaxID=61149 RepID=A0A2P2NN23_RHIMU